METKMIRVPFEEEMAKRIQNNECEGRIVTRGGYNARIICWDKKSDCYYNIVALIDCVGTEKISSYNKNGYVITGKEEYDDLFLEIPEYMTFKDGDLLTYWPNDNRWCIFIYKSRDKDVLSNYVTYDCDSRGNNILTFGKSSYTSTWCTRSTESEKQSLIDALKKSKEPKAKEYLKLFFDIVMDDKYEKFEFKQDVLVRQHDEDIWCAAQFSHKELDRYVVFGGNYFIQCIPYNEETAHLLGTKNNI